MKYSDLSHAMALASWTTPTASSSPAATRCTCSTVRARRMTCIPVVHEVAAGIADGVLQRGGRARAEGAGVRAGHRRARHHEHRHRDGRRVPREPRAPGRRRSGEVDRPGRRRTAPAWHPGGRRRRARRTRSRVGRRRIESPWAREARRRGRAARAATGRPGPVFLEVCLDAQGATGRRTAAPRATAAAVTRSPPEPRVRRPRARSSACSGRLDDPCCCSAAACSRAAAARGAAPRCASSTLPVMTTWNGADRIGADDPVYAGRPNTWGQRAANVLLQQADLVVALGTPPRPPADGLQLAGVRAAAPGRPGRRRPGRADKGHPHVDLAVLGDADAVLRHITAAELPGLARVARVLPRGARHCSRWSRTRTSPRPATWTRTSFVADALRTAREPTTSSSRAAAAVRSRSRCRRCQQKAGQVVVTDKGLASMGYGLSGAIGAGLAHRVVARS